MTVGTIPFRQVPGVGTTRFKAHARSGWLVFGLALVFAGTAQAHPVPDQNAGAGSSGLRAGTGLAQSIQSNRRAATSGNKIRTTVRKGFLAINAANKKLYVCKWGSCTKAGKTLRKTARRWLGALRPLKAEAKIVAKGLTAAKTSLRYWARAGLDAINVDAAVKAKRRTKFVRWYKLYRAHFTLGVKYQNRAVDILSRG